MSRPTIQLVVGWLILTICGGVLALIIPPLIPVVAVAWLIAAGPVVTELGRSFASGRDQRTTPGLPVAPIEPSGMILLREADRDPRWRVAKSRQQGQRSGHLHVNRPLRSLTDCPAGHYDYHELRGSSLNRVVRRCAWCPPPADTWTEGLVTGEDSKR